MQELIPILIPVTFIAGLILERVFPAQRQPKVRFWLLKGIVFFFIMAALNAVLPAAVAIVVGERAPLHLSSLGTPLGALIGFLVADFVSYWIHRGMHNSHFIWRWTHQMHHSAERVDLAGMSYNHPLGMLAVFVPPGLVTGMLGLSPQAGALAGLLGFLYAVVPHSNLKTPWWIGYLVQRPEAHKVHHTRGVHAFNYGGFPLWDIAFGTFRSPREISAEYGFWNGASSRVGAMLLGRDVGEPTSRPSEGAVS